MEEDEPVPTKENDEETEKAPANSLGWTDEEIDEDIDDLFRQLGE